MGTRLGTIGALPPRKHGIMDLIARARAMSLPARVLLGLGAAMLAAVIRVEFLAGLLGDRNPYVTFVITIPLVALLAGSTAGMTTTVFGALLAHLIVRWPAGLTDYVLLGTFIVSSSIIVGLVAMMHRFYTHAQRSAVEAARVEDFSTFITQAPAAIAMFDCEMRYLASSQLWIQLFSPDQPDLLGRCHYDVFPNLPEHWIDAHRRGLAGEALLEQLDGVDTPPFGKRWFRWEVQPWRHRDGAIGGITIFGEDVTERVEKDLALRQSEARLRAFFANIGVGAVMLGTDGRFIEVSDHFCTMTGFTRAELVGVMTTSELTHEADRDADRAALQSYFAGEIPYFISEKRYRCKDGTLIWVRVTAAPIREEDGRIVQSAGIVENVTERKHAEDTLRKNEERMSLAFQATQDGIWDWNIETDEVFYSSRWKTMLGYEEHEIEPHISAWKRLVHPEDIPRVMEAVGRGTLGQADDIEYRMLHKDGHYVHILSRSMPVRRDLDGSVVRMVGTHFDLTERRRREALLRESEERLAMALEAAEAGVWEMRPDTGKFVLQIRGIAPGTPATMALAASAERSADWPRAQDAIAATLRTGKPLRFELALPDPDGSTRWLLYRGARFDAAEGGRLIGIVQDITSRKLAEEAIVRSRDMLAEAEKIAHLGSFEYIAATDQTVWSEEAYRIYGLDPRSPSPTYDVLIRQRIHPEDADTLIKAHTQALRDHRMFELEHRLMRPDGSERWVLTRARPDVDKDGALIRLIGTVQDTTDRKKAALAVAASEERLRLALSAGHMAIWDWDLVSGQVRWNDELYMMLGYEPGSITPSYEAWASRVHPSDREWVRSHLEETPKAGGIYNAVYRVLGDRNETRWLEAHGRVEVDAQGHAKRSYGVIIDITTRKQADELKAVLLQEVDHRAKNLLSVVQSIAQLTPTDGSPQQFLAAFNSRLQGLAASHDLLVNAEWKGVGVEELVRSQLPHFKSLIGSRILLQGASVTLKPAAAQAIGMAIHELATNAVKYGALATPDGIIRLSWSSRSPDGTDPQTFRMEWSEEGGPPVTPPTRRGFGYTVLVEMPEHILDARVELTYAPAGIVWRATLPLDRATV